MGSPLESLIARGTKLWLDSIDPELVRRERALGATGATSNPIIVADLIRGGRFDHDLEALMRRNPDDSVVAWLMTDQLVREAQEVFLPVWEQTTGNDGYVSFELDPLLEDHVLAPPHDRRVERYLELGQQWSEGHKNRLIKVPATAAGIDALEELAAAGVPLNVTLIFSSRQYQAARDAVWRGARRCQHPELFKSVYSIFVSRLDVYTEQHVPQLSPASQGSVGIVNAKRIWRENQAFWSEKPVSLDQEIVFASTGTKKPMDDAWKYLEAFAGSDIETNPPATNVKYQASGRTASRNIDHLPPDDILNEIDREVDMEKLEQVLMEEGLKKFADPQKGLLTLIAAKRAALVGA